MNKISIANSLLVFRFGWFFVRCTNGTSNKNQSKISTMKLLDLEIWWRRGELNPSPKIASVMTLHV